MMWGRQRQPEVSTGSRYQSVLAAQVVATATVLSVAEIDGLPHVRFDLRLRQPSGAESDGGVRVLSLATFFRQYPLSAVS